MKMKEINESREMQSSAFRYRSFHQEWRRRKSTEKKKSSSKKMHNKHLLSASSHQFQKQFQISRGSTRSSTTSWSGIRVQPNLLYHNHSNSTSQRTRLTWESTWTLRTKSSIQRRRREQDHTPWTKILPISKKSILQQPRSMKPWSRWEDSTRPTSSLRRQRSMEKIKSELSSSLGWPTESNSHQLLPIMLLSWRKREPMDCKEQETKWNTLRMFTISKKP